MTGILIMGSLRTEYDAIVIGAGPAGSTAAIRLAQAGWSVAIIEKHAFPRRKVCGECIAATNLPLLDTLGVGEAFAAAAGPSLHRVALMSGSHTLEADLPARPDRQHRWGRALGRETLDTLLLARASALGATVLQPWTVRAIVSASDEFSCTVDAPDGAAAMLHAPLVVTAQGSWDPTLTAATTQRLPRLPGDLFAFKANFRAARLAQGLLPVLAFAGGYGGMVVGDRGVTTLACCIRRDALRRLRGTARGSAADAVEAYLKSQCAGVRLALDDAHRDGKWLSIGPIRPGVRVVPSDRGPFAVGNAAGEAHPIIGEGISMAMQSAWLLCDRLLGSPDVLRRADVRRQVGRDYATAWRRAFVPRIRLAAVFAHAAMHPQAAALLLPALERWPQMLTRAARLSGKVRCAVDPFTPQSLLKT